MRPVGRPAVAPLNPNPKWPEGYIAVLREMGATEKSIPFLVLWVQRFFARYPGQSRRALGRTDIETFLAEMGRRADISNWQIAQARDALELYYEQFRGIALPPRPDARVAETPPATSVINREHLRADRGLLDKNRKGASLPKDDGAHRHPEATTSHSLLYNKETKTERNIFVKRSRHEQAVHRGFVQVGPAERYR